MESECLLFIFILFSHFSFFLFFHYGSTLLCSLLDFLLVKHIYLCQYPASKPRTTVLNSPGISGIQLALLLQKNSPLGGNASGSSSDPTQI